MPLWYFFYELATAHHRYNVCVHINMPLCIWLRFILTNCWFLYYKVGTLWFLERWKLLFLNLSLFFSKCVICCDMTGNLWSSVENFQACLGVKTIIYHQQWKALWSGATWTDANALISLNVQPNMVLNWFVSGAMHPTRIMFGIICHYCL